MWNTDYKSLNQTLFGSTQPTEHMGVPLFSLAISTIWILLVRVIKTQNLSLEGSGFLKLLRNSSKFVLIFYFIFQKLGWHIPVGRSFLKSVFHAHASPNPDPCARIKCFQIIFSRLEPRIYYDFGKWRAIHAGVIDLLVWVAYVEYGLR